MQEIEICCIEGRLFL